MARRISSTDQPDALALALQNIRRIEAEIDNMKSLLLKLQARTLKLELAVSAHVPMARENIWPETEVV